jgi:hypothetical protein
MLSHYYLYALCLIFFAAVLNGFLYRQLGLLYITTPPSIFTNSFIVMIALWPADVEVLGAADPVWRGALLASLGIQVAVVIGFMRATNVEHYKNFLNAEVLKSGSSNENLMSFLFMGLIITLSCFLYYQNTVGFSLLESLLQAQKSEAEFIVGREAAFKWLDPRWGQTTATQFFYVLLVLRMWILPLLFLVAIAILLSKTNLVVKAASLLQIFLSIILLSSNLARAPVAALFFRIFIFLAVSDGGAFKKNKRVLLSAIGLMLGIPILLTNIIKSESITTTVTGIVRRLVRQPAFDAAQFYNYCSNVIELQNGELLLRPLKQILGIPHFYIENEIYHYIYGPSIKVFSGHNNAAFVANAYCDFGVTGIIGFSLFISFLCMQCFYWIAKSPKTIINTVIFSCIGYQVMIFNFGSITSVLISNGLIFTILFKLIWDLICAPKKG